VAGQEKAKEDRMQRRTSFGGPWRFARLAMLAWLSSALWVTAVQAQQLDALPRYQPEQKVSGTIRLWGHGSFKSDFMGKLVKSWGDGFAKYQPEVRLENKMYGTASAIGALYTGNGDIAILGEEISPAAAAAFERAKHYPPLGIEIATGSLDVAFFDYAHVVFVHKDNPLSRLTLTQADAIFGAEHRLGTRNIRTWGELGLSGEWSRKRIQPYAWKDLDFSLFIQEVMLGGSHRWNNDLKEFAHLRRPDGSLYEHGQQILDALASDRFGIAISNLRYANPQVKPVAVASRDGQPYYEATKENLISQNYPLTRIIPAFIDRKPGQPVDPKVREFLRYILSREGQQDIVRDTGYLPLDARVIREQLKKLQ
jgi:phosphate transport system substrate-binding protein